MKHLPFTDAFVDESIRGRRYLMGCVLVEARHLHELRPAVRSLALHQRVHFNNESVRQKRRVLAAIADMPIAALVVVCPRGHGITEFAARASCLTAIVDVVQNHEVGRLVIESRNDDREDERLLRRVRRAEPPLIFEHRLGSAEPMLWVADAVTWACGAGSPWRSLIDPIVDDVIELRP